ncbi:MAG: OmpH family outer membrane protein [Bacteroidales bacterium]|nr:OmpH family outer membrane protein [Bacteroidales bacterium]
MKKVFLMVAMAICSMAAFAQPKFAHVNFNELVQLCPDADKARETMIASRNEAQETGQAMVEEYQTKLQKYQQGGATWSQSIRESKEKELVEIQSRIQEFQQNVQAELEQQQQKLMAPIYKKAHEVVDELAKSYGFIYVFDATSILYIDAAQSTDLTPEARKAMGVPEGRTFETLQAELQAKQQQIQ